MSISLPAGNYSTLNFLALAGNGNQSHQTFTVIYTDGTTETFTQSVSERFTTEDYGGEDLANGTADNLTFHVYGYTLKLRVGKTVQSIRLPNNGNVKILAMSLV